MSRALKKIRDALERFDSTPASAGLDLRLSLSGLILKHLECNGWTQGELARRAGLKEPYISRVLHGNANCTLDTVGKLLFALGTTAQLQERGVVSEPPVVTRQARVSTYPKLKLLTQDSTYGEETTKQEASTEEETIIGLRYASSG